MGGKDHQNYNKFITICCKAFTELRKKASLIINLLRLMLDAGIKDLTEQSLQKVQNHFLLDSDDESAEMELSSIIMNSTGAFLPKLLEWAHNIARDVAR